MTWSSPMPLPDGAIGEVSIRTTMQPGDLGRIISLHGMIYARERGWDHTFEAYVAAPLSEFARRDAPREQIWIAERGGGLVGCIAIVAASAETAQLRWFLVDPSARGTGLGKRLLRLAIAFARDCGYGRLMLWTERSLATAAHLYHAMGFRKTDEKPGHQWGASIVEEKYEMTLHEGAS